LFPQTLVAENINPTSAGPSNDGPLWFCLKSQTKHEHIAAAHLRQNSAVEVFLPRIRFKRATRQGTVWVTEALFPGYLFARFDWQASLRLVQHSRGVRGVVHFGQRWPAIPDEIIRDLQQAIGTEELRTIPETFIPGDEVEISEGAMRGLRAVVTRVLPGRERIAVLMEFLGRQTTVELPRHFLVKEGNERLAIFTGGSTP
jgi:transcriptional antiterminator RfaH